MWIDNEIKITITLRMRKGGEKQGYTKKKKKKKRKKKRKERKKRKKKE
jgi:hypothetical protein